MPPITFGILGCGRGAFAAAVASHMPQDIQIAAVCDVKPERARAAAQAHGVDTVYTRYEDLLADGRVDAVVIATPDHQHAGQAVRALQAGKHVLSEIPAAYTLGELHAIVEAAGQSRKQYMMGNEVRWFPAVQAARRSAEEGKWGDIFYGEAEYLHNLRREGWSETEPDGAPHWRWDPAHPQTTLLGGGPHAFDTLRWLSGEEGYVEVFAYGVGRSVTDHPEPATCVCLLRAGSGAAHKVTVSYAMVRPYCLYFSLYGTHGSFEGGRVNQEDTFFVTDQMPADARLVPTGVPYWTDPSAPAAVGHGTSEYFMMREFVNAIREGRQPAIGPREAARSIAPAICAFESIRSGRPVAVPRFD
jgi:predicted dehydrogenase